MATIYIGFVIQPGIEADAFISNAKKLINKYTRYKLCCSKDDVILFEDLEISLAAEPHTLDNQVQPEVRSDISQGSSS